MRWTTSAWPQGKDVINQSEIFDAQKANYVDSTEEDATDTGEIWVQD